MATYKLREKWTAAHTTAFLNLKTALTSQPVLHAPRYDGTPFIVTMDRCQEGLGAVLTQQTSIRTPASKTVTKTLPIAFALKCTSTSEWNYKPFLLEFTALKFGLDHFLDIIWGYPVEIETDWQALKDVLSNTQASATHVQWHDGIITHNIVAVWHIQGCLNVVTDGLSRQWDHTEHTITQEDGSEWSVNHDPEAITGLVNDIFTLDKLDHTYQILRERFTNEPLYLEVIDAILNIDTKTSVRDCNRARHRASQYMIDNGKLWCLHGGTSVRPRSHIECISCSKAKVKAEHLHSTAGHWGRDTLKITLTDKYHSPKLDISVMKAIQNCGQCKNFSTTHALLEPIIRWHPFELLVGNYLSMPTGKGGYHTLGLYLDTFSQHLWVMKFKMAGTAKTTVDSLSTIFNAYTAAEAFMSDGGKHFDNAMVKEFCAKWSCTHHVVAVYSPWINGLVEGTNKLLLHVLDQMNHKDNA